MPKIFARFFGRLRSPGLNKDKAPETPPKAPILLLPAELTLMIHRYLDRIDTICLALTCKDFKNAWLKPQKHPKYLPTYRVPVFDGTITYFVYLERKRRFWELWRIYSERWELLRRLARDSPGYTTRASDASSSTGKDLNDEREKVIKRSLNPNHPGTVAGSLNSQRHTRLSSP